MSDFTIENGVLTKYEGTDMCVRVPDDVRAIGDNVFYGNGRIKQVILPESVETIGNMAFGSCRQLIGVQFPPRLKSLGESAFYSCDQLCRIKIPEGIEVLRAHCFDNCKSLHAVHLPSTLRAIDESAFFGCGELQDLLLPEGLEEIGAWAFQSCHSLSKIMLPNTVRRIGAGAFRDSGLKRIDIPDGVEKIEAATFSKCIYLKTVRFGCGMKVIGQEAFKTCRSLTRVHIPAGVRDIEPRAFARCAYLEDFSVNLRNPYLCMKDGVLYTKDGSEAISGRRDLQQLELPEGVRRIRAGAFSDCRQLRSVSFPRSTEEIGRGAFDDCPIGEVRFEGKGSLIAAAMPGVEPERVYAPDIRDVPPKWRAAAAVTFALECPQEPDDRFESYDRYIAANIEKMKDAAAKHPEVVRLICERKLLTAMKFGTILDAVNRGGNTESAARLLEYRNSVLGQAAFDRLNAQNARRSEKAFDRMLERTGRTDARGLRFAARGKLAGYPNRNALKRALAAHGAILCDAITGTTDIVITNEPDATAKYMKSIEYGADVINESELAERFGVRPEDGR